MYTLTSPLNSDGGRRFDITTVGRRYGRNGRQKFKKNKTNKSSVINLLEKKKRKKKYVENISRTNDVGTEIRIDRYIVRLKSA